MKPYLQLQAPETKGQPIRVGIAGAAFKQQQDPLQRNLNPWRLRLSGAMPCSRTGFHRHGQNLRQALYHAQTTVGTHLAGNGTDACR